jgi:class 3 adenylate cyclase
VQKNVRELLDSKKASQNHSDVTILHCEIDDYDSLVKFYEHGDGLFETLEQL